MIAVLQRVKRAAVCVDGKEVGACGEGLCILLGVAKGDGEEDARALAEKIVNLRIFSDENGKVTWEFKVSAKTSAKRLRVVIRSENTYISFYIPVTDL